MHLCNKTFCSIFTLFSLNLSAYYEININYESGFEYESQKKLLIDLQKESSKRSIENLIKNKVIIRVTDNGEGIEQEHLPRLFERFYRVDKSGSRKEGGSGLGLAIVKHIIEAHSEQIYIESQLGVGSEFSFTLEKAK